MKMELSPASQNELNRAIKALADISGKTIQREIPKQARLFCVDLAHNTKPEGKGNKGNIKMIEGRIESKIKSVYLALSSARAIMKKADKKQYAAFNRLVRGFQYTQATKLFNEHSGHGVSISRFGTFDGGQLHKSQRFGKSVKLGMIVTDYASVRKYILEIKKLIRFGKGGFATAAKQLGGTRGIPNHRSKQKAPGSGQVRGDGKEITVIITNNVRYIRQALEVSSEQKAIAFRKRQVETVMKSIMDRKMKQVSPSLK